MGSRKRILIICPYPPGCAPSQRLKYEQYLDYFRANGYDITISPFMTLAFWMVAYRKGCYVRKVFWTLFGYLRRFFDLFRLPFYDGVYIHLWVVPLGPPVFEWLYCRVNPTVIYDIDDMVFLLKKEKHSVNRLINVFKSEGRIFHLMKKAKHVITCTPALDGLVRRFNPNTTDISSTINTEEYVPAAPSGNGKPITLGWSGSHSSSRYLYLLRNVLLDLRQEMDFRLVVIGDPEFHIEGLEVTSLPWVERTEVRDLQQIDIGLYPLSDDDWVLGKSGLKALQYMALGIPTVATAVGANFRVIKDSVSGFLVRTEEEWKSRIRQLSGDPALRRRIGENARRRVEKHYSVRANRDTYLGILDSVVN
jgi:glycosyltransferase involved in cell wall biosynthesis